MKNIFASIIIVILLINVSFGQEINEKIKKSLNDGLTTAFRNFSDLEKKEFYEKYLSYKKKSIRNSEFENYKIQIDSIICSPIISNNEYLTKLISNLSEGNKQYWNFKKEWNNYIRNKFILSGNIIQETDINDRMQGNTEKTKNLHLSIETEDFKFCDSLINTDIFENFSIVRNELYNPTTYIENQIGSDSYEFKKIRDLIFDNSYPTIFKETNKDIYMGLPLIEYRILNNPSVNFSVMDMNGQIFKKNSFSLDFGIKMFNFNWAYTNGYNNYFSVYDMDMGFGINIIDKYQNSSFKMRSSGDSIIMLTSDLKKTKLYLKLFVGNLGIITNYKANFKWLDFNPNYGLRLIYEYNDKLILNFGIVINEFGFSPTVACSGGNFNSTKPLKSEIKLR